MKKNILLLLLAAALLPSCRRSDSKPVARRANITIFTIQGVTYTDSAVGAKAPLFQAEYDEDPNLPAFHLITLDYFYVPGCRVNLSGRKTYLHGEGIEDTGIYNVGGILDSTGNTVAGYGNASVVLGADLIPENSYNAYPDSGSSWIHVTKADYKEVTGTINIKMYRESDSAITYLTGSFHSYK